MNLNFLSFAGFFSLALALSFFNINQIGSIIITSAGIFIALYVLDKLLQMERTNSDNYSSNYSKMVNNLILCPK